MPTATWETDGALLTEFLTLNSGESPKEENASTLSQILQVGVPSTYFLSPKACLGILRRASARGKELPEVLRIALEQQASAYTSYFYVQYNGNKYAYLFNTTSTFGWTEYSAVIPDVVDGTITVYAYNRLASLYVSDIILAEGSAVHKWTPAPNEIYTTEVKIDRRGIEVSNADSGQRTVITNQEFSGYYNEEKIFTLNKDETITKKTTVDGELTVGKTKFVPMPTASEGLNIVILD